MISNYREYKMEAEILKEIKDSEKEADEIIEKANIEKEKMVEKARFDSSKLLDDKKDEIRLSQEKKIVDFREKAKSAKNEKLKEGKKVLRTIKTKAEANITEAVDLIIKKFEDLI